MGVGVRIVDEVVSEVRAIFEMIENEPKKGELELELRFGTVNERGHFVPGISRSFMDSAISRLQTNSACKASEWIEHEDYFYTVEQKGQAEQIRTRVTFDPYEFHIKRAHTAKRRIGTVTINAGEYALRVALSRETEISESLIPAHVETERVRIQQRKSIGWSREANQKNMPWCYEFSLTWAAPSKSKVEDLRALPDKCVHEFEIELDVESDYFKQHSSEYLARSLLLKATDFFESHVDLTFGKSSLLNK